MSKTSSTRISALLLTGALALSACGGDDTGIGAGGGGGGGEGGTDVDLSGVSLAVGSKEFTEQLVLGQITIEALRAGGALVRDETGLEGSKAARRALISGDIDMYWEYTGTAQLVFLEQSPIADAERQYRAVSQADEANGIVWLEPAPANNAYGIAVRREARRPLDVSTISDLERVVARSPRDASLCAAEEFLRRPDGLPGIERTYGFDYPSDLVVRLRDEGRIYGEVERGARCTFGEVFLTDGRITANDLVVLEDDRRFSTTYNPALNVRAEVLRRYPELEELFEEIASRLDTATLRDLNAAVDIEGRSPDEVARSFLDANGITG